jgi:hypothetical protein
MVLSSPVTHCLENAWGNKTKKQNKKSIVLLNGARGWVIRVGGGSCLAVFVPLFVLGSPLAATPLSPPPSAEGRVAEATVSLVNQMGVPEGGGGRKFAYVSTG